MVLDIHNWGINRKYFQCVSNTYTWCLTFPTDGYSRSNRILSATKHCSYLAFSQRTGTSICSHKVASRCTKKSNWTWQINWSWIIPMVGSSKRTFQYLNLAQCLGLLWNSRWLVFVWSLRKSATCHPRYLNWSGSILASHNHRRAWLHCQWSSAVVCNSIRCGISNHSRGCYYLWSVQAPWGGDAVYLDSCYHWVCFPAPPLYRAYLTQTGMLSLPTSVASTQKSSTAWHSSWRRACTLQCHQSWFGTPTIVQDTTNAPRPQHYSWWLRIVVGL